MKGSFKKNEADPEGKTGQNVKLKKGESVGSGTLKYQNFRY